MPTPPYSTSSHQAKPTFTFTSFPVYEHVFADVVKPSLKETFEDTLEQFRQLCLTNKKEAIKHYKQLAKEYHPDIGGDENKFKQIVNIKNQMLR